MTGVSPAMLTLWMPSYSSNVTEWNSFFDQVELFWKEGHLIHLAWSWYENPFNQEVIFWGKGVERERKCVSLMIKGMVMNLEWKKHLDFLAPFLTQLQNKGIIPFINILPYLDWYNNRIWSGRPGVNGSAKIFQMTQNI